jgi:hypothetical protein
MSNWNSVCAIAKQAGAKFPELVAAQWALESGWGKHVSGKHNYFGLKGVGTDVNTKEFINGQWITIKEGFIDFPDLEACVVYLVDRWYKDFKRFYGVNRAMNIESAARMLYDEGYATDPKYEEKLMDLIMRQRELEKVEVPKKEVVLYRMEALQDTWLKKQKVQSSDLGGDERVAVAAGRVYAVTAYSEQPGDAHAQVQLGHGAGQWYVFEPHWRKIVGAGEAVRRQVDWSDFNFLVTPHLTVGEVTRWDQRRIPKSIADQNRILETAKQFEALRLAWGSPIGVTSFFRPEPINRQVGGVSGSWHVSGCAMDVYPVKGDISRFYQWLLTRWTGAIGDGRPRGFVHLDTRGGGGFVASGGVEPIVPPWVY